MTIKQRKLPNRVWLVSASGRLDQSQNAQLEERLQSLLQTGHSRFIVDLSDVNYINSGGLRCLVSAWRTAKQQDGNVFLCAMTPRVQGIFNMIGFDKVFRIFPTQEEASRYWQDSSGSESQETG